MRNFLRFIPGQKPDLQQRIYEKIEKLPIYDYHCHLDAKEIFENKPFDNIGVLLLEHDHYKWRLMRQYGIDEYFITGAAAWEDKFKKYADVLSMAAGSPLQDWTQMELYQYFGIKDRLTAETALDIWNRANEVIRTSRMSPRGLISKSNVRYIATTNDICEDLSYHKKLAGDATFQTVVTPSFRADNLLLILRPDYPDYIKKLSECSGVLISDFSSFKEAVEKRLDYFCACGCKFTDVGIEYFPRIIGSDEDADEVFQKALNGDDINTFDYSSFLGNMFVFLGIAYKKRNLVMQLHLAAKRNADSVIFRTKGADMGCDCMGDAIPGEALIAILDTINACGGLPHTILYTMNPAWTAQMVSIAGCFRNVVPGAAWWMCDHKRGIADIINTICETGHIATFYGMLTDSRSFTSYSRHDYFRRILSVIAAGWVENGSVDEAMAVRICERICNANIRQLIENKK